MIARETSVKVLRVIARLNIGGPARQAVILHEGLRARQFDTRLIHGSLGQGEGSLEDLVRDSAHVTKIPELGRGISAWSDVRAFLQLTRIVFSEQPDVVHTHTAKAGTLGRLAAMAYNATRDRRRRCLVVHTFHGNVFTGYFGRAGSFAVRGIERLLALATDRIIAISERQCVEVVDRFRIASTGRVAIVPLGLDLDPLLGMDGGVASMREELRLPPHAVVFCYMGRLVRIKDVPTLLAAFARVHEEEPATYLLLVGDGDERAALEAQARSLGIGEATRFAGWRHDLGRVYRTADVVVLSSLNEGTPVGVIEAMAAARAVVATDVGGVADVIMDGETGVLVPPRSAEALATALLDLARRPGERDRLGSAARRCVQQYRAERLVEDIARLYWEGLASKRGVRVDDLRSVV